MNFRQVATEIMLTANEEKWYETRERIEKAVAQAYIAGAAAPLSDLDRYHAAQHIVQSYSWQDQPDGVR